MAKITLLHFFFTKLKKPKNIVRGMKSWNLVENGLYFENIEEKTQKSYFKGVKTSAG